MMNRKIIWKIFQNRTSFFFFFPKIKLQSKYFCWMLYELIKITVKNLFSEQIAYTVHKQIICFHSWWPTKFVFSLSPKIRRRHHYHIMYVSASKCTFECNFSLITKKSKNFTTKTMLTVYTCVLLLQISKQEIHIHMVFWNLV